MQCGRLFLNTVLYWMDVKELFEVLLLLVHFLLYLAFFFFRYVLCFLLCRKKRVFSKCQLLGHVQWFYSGSYLHFDTICSFIRCIWCFLYFLSISCTCAPQRIDLLRDGNAEVQRAGIKWSIVTLYLFIDCKAVAMCTLVVGCRQQILGSFYDEKNFVTS